MNECMSGLEWAIVQWACDARGGGGPKSAYLNK